MYQAQGEHEFLEDCLLLSSYLNLACQRMQLLLNELGIQLTIEVLPLNSPTLAVHFEKTYHHITTTLSGLRLTTGNIKSGTIQEHYILKTFKHLIHTCQLSAPI